jgi:hypothetical protein
MPRLLRPRTEDQRAAATTLVNVVFVALITWLLAGALPAPTDSMLTSSLRTEAPGR